MDDAEEKGRIQHSLTCPPCCSSKAAAKASSALHACLHFSQQFVSLASTPLNKQAAPSQACCSQAGKTPQAAGTALLTPQSIFQLSFPQEHLGLVSARCATSRAQLLSCHTVLSHSPCPVTVSCHTAPVLSHSPCPVTVLSHCPVIQPLPCHTVPVPVTEPLSHCPSPVTLSQSCHTPALPSSCTGTPSTSHCASHEDPVTKAEGSQSPGLEKGESCTQTTHHIPGVLKGTRAAQSRWGHTCDPQEGTPRVLQVPPFTCRAVRWDTFCVRAPTLPSPPYTRSPGSIFTSFSLPPAWSLQGIKKGIWRGRNTDL